MPTLKGGMYEAQVGAREGDTIGLLVRSSVSKLKTVSYKSGYVERKLE
jgi:hypothetical protein